jgi:CheY-like chemotaxis protein
MRDAGFVRNHRIASGGRQSMVSSLAMTLPEHMQLCLTAPLATTVWVGDDLVVHGNDAFRGLAGAQLCAAVLGRPAREGFGELWDLLEPLVARAPTVVRDVRLVFDRSVAREEVFATIAIARITGGIQCSWLETTDHVVARRRLETMRELGGAPMRARTVNDACSALLAVLASNPHDITEAAIRRAGTGDSALAWPVGDDLELMVRPSHHRPFDTGCRTFCDRVADRATAAIDAAAAHALAGSVARREAQDEFLGVLAHELRNPLMPALTTLDVMRLRGSTEELELIDRPLRRLARLLDDVLEYSRIARGMLKVVRERVALARVVDRALELAGPFADSVAVRVPRAGFLVVADVDYLARAISNILVVAGDRGEPASLDATRDGDRLVVTVRHGCIEGVEHMFEPFATAPRGGLGLAIARSIVELHGGGVRAAIIDDMTHIAIELPIEAMAVVPAAEPVRQRSHKRVLIVEDNDDTARALKNALELLGHEVALAHNGPVALTVARAFRPDVALLDISLPVMDGYELANRLRAITVATRELHIVAVTAYGTDAHRRRSHEAGFAEHLVKPVDLAKLERVVEALD